MAAKTTPTGISPVVQPTTIQPADSIVGSLMIGVINNGLLLMGLEYSQQLIARGVIIIVAVAISQSRK